MQLGKLLDIHHTAFLSSFFIGLSRVTIVFSYCPQIAKASLHVGGQCLDIKQNMHSKSYINLHKLYKRKKKVMSKKKKKQQKRQQQNNAEINWNTAVGRFASACVHPLSDSSVGASDLMAGKQKLA